MQGFSRLSPPPKRGVVAAEGDRIIYAGPAAGAPQFAGAQRVDCRGRWITPGLIDCHTQPPMRATGRMSSSAPQRRELRGDCAVRRRHSFHRAGNPSRDVKTTHRTVAAAPDALIAEGVTTVEIKSGYGLTLEDEIKMLRAARALGDKVNVPRRSSAPIPARRRADIEVYTDHVCDMIATVEPMADAVDVFCERIAFTPEQTARISWRRSATA